MRWINFLHLYQPANIDSYSIKQALDKSYYRLIRLMEENQNLKMTWNISGCLLLRLEDEGKHDFINRLQSLVASKRLELVSTAAYHPLLPLIPASETIRQIKENEKILRHFFGSKFKTAGFFLPEMAYSPAVGKLIKELGYKWIILDEFAFSGGLERPNFRRFYLDKHSGLKIIFRNRPYSSSYPPDKLLHEKSEQRQEKIIITATDAELYGLRHQDPTGELERAAKRSDLKTDTVSGFIDWISSQGIEPEEVAIKSGSWESSRKELSSGKYFNLWQDKKNKIHVQLWRLANLVLSLDKEFRQDRNYRYYRWHLVRGLASCTFWWASARDFSKIFGPYAWNPDGIERGLEDLIRAVRSLDDRRSRKYKLKAEKQYLKIKKLIWEEHWRKHWKKAP